MPEAGGTATEVSKRDAATGEISHRWPHVVSGTRAIVQIGEGTVSLSIYDVGRNSLAPIAGGAVSRQAPLWTSDGARVIYRGTRQGLRNLFWRPVDASGEEERLSRERSAPRPRGTLSQDRQWQHALERHQRWPALSAGSAGGTGAARDAHLGGVHWFDEVTRRVAGGGT